MCKLMEQQVRLSNASTTVSLAMMKVHTKSVNLHILKIIMKVFHNDETPLQPKTSCEPTSKN